MKTVAREVESGSQISDPEVYHHHQVPSSKAVADFGSGETECGRLPHEQQRSSQPQVAPATAQEVGAASDEKTKWVRLAYYIKLC